MFFAGAFKKLCKLIAVWAWYLICVSVCADISVFKSRKVFVKLCVKVFTVTFAQGKSHAEIYDAVNALVYRKYNTGEKYVQTYLPKLVKLWRKYYTQLIILFGGEEKV